MPKVVIVTGASSGMGRETAVRLARRGDSVVLAARRAPVLDEVARECEDAGGRALVVATDVSEHAQVEALVQQAVARFGRVDAVVHAAAVASFGAFWEVPPATMRQLVETDLVGSMYVARETIRQLLRQEDGGTLVLVSSVLGKTPIPYLNVYNAAKHGVVGLATSLRADLKEAGVTNVNVVDLMPPSTDTPFYLHAANYVGKVPKPPPPSYDVGTLAEAILEAIDDPQDEVTVGAMGKLMRFAHGVAPGLYETATGPYSESMFLDEEAERSDGNVFSPVPQGTTPGGGWKEGTLLERRRSG